METGDIQKEIAVSCVYWNGDFRGRKYSTKWVEKLRNMVKRNMEKEYDFYCLSNVPFEMEGVNVLPLQYNWPGWWAKMEVFLRDEFEGYNAVLNLDLDILIPSRIDDLFDLNSNTFMKCAPQTEKGIGSIDKEGKRRVQLFRTGAFCFNPNVATVWASKFESSPKKYIEKYRGDQDWWGDMHSKDIKTYPKGWFVKTKHLKNGKEPDDTVKIVFCNHIKNDEAVKKWKWASEIWK